MSARNDRRAALLKELEALERKRNQLIARLEKTETGEAAGPRSRGHAVPVRDLVLNALEDLECLAFSRELMLYMDARYGREVPPARFGTLSKDEEAAHESSRPRPVYLCHGLTSERFEAIKRLWGRSDWPLWRRMVAPTTGRVQHLQMTVVLCDVALAADDQAAKPEMLRILAADHARDVPGLTVKRGTFALETWRDAAAALLKQHAPADRERREEAALRLKRAGLADRCALFGASEKPAVYGVTSSADER
jgi:hypothetical protein